MVSTARKLKIEHLPCAIHSIQLVIRDALVDSSPQPVQQKVLQDFDRQLLYWQFTWKYWCGGRGKYYCSIYYQKSKTSNETLQSEPTVE